jgi:hypothetical protein
MLRFPNPGSTIANFVSVYAAAFKALNGRVVDLDDLVRAVVDANLATSSGYVGDEAVSRSTRDDRSRDPLYNQMKMYAELFRTMGWLHPTQASSLSYTFTLLGEQLVAAGQEYWPLLKQCVLGIAYPTRVLTVMGDANLRPFAFILKTMKASGGYLSRDEMIIGPLSAASDQDARIVADVAAKITVARRNEATMDAALTAVSKSRSIQINTLQNYTRWPIAVLRDSGWVEPFQARLGDGRKYKVFALTESGREIATMLESAIDLRLSDVEALTQEVRDAVALVAHFRMLDRAGFDIAPIQDRVDKALMVTVATLPLLSDTRRAILFSPFQSLALDDVQRAFPGHRASVRVDKAVETAAAALGGRDDRSHLFVAPRLVAVAREASAEADALRDELRNLLRTNPDPREVAKLFCRRHAQDTKEVFYPLVTHLFQVLGFRSDYSRAGVNYQRWDACVWVGDYALPVEIKSPTEEVFLATKAVRQALENKVVLMSRGGLATTRELSSLVVGFRVPKERGDMSNLIDNVFDAFGFRLGVIDLGSLAYLAAKSVRDGVTIDANQLAHLRGFLDV